MEVAIWMESCLPGHMQRIGTDFIIQMQNTLLYMPLSCCKIKQQSHSRGQKHVTSHRIANQSSPVLLPVKSRCVGTRYVGGTISGLHTLFVQRTEWYLFWHLPGWQKWLCMPLSIKLGKDHSSMGEKIRLNWALYKWFLSSGARNARQLNFVIYQEEREKKKKKTD